MAAAPMPVLASALPIVERGDRPRKKRGRPDVRLRKGDPVALWRNPGLEGLYRTRMGAIMAARRAGREVS